LSESYTILTLRKVVLDNRFSDDELKK